MKELEEFNSDEEIEIDLDDSDSIKEINLIDEDGEVNSPAPTRLELEGVTTEEEIIFIKSKVLKEEVRDSFPLYIVFGLDKKQIGFIDLSLDNILELKFIGINKYTLTLIAENNSVDILSPNMDTVDINRMLNFVRIRS